VICYLLFGGVPLEADATRLDPDFSGKQLQGPQFRPEEEWKKRRRRKIKNFAQ
jgi:hypothetical protein